MAECNVKFCSKCSKQNIQHEFQDKKYGKFNRVMNPIGKGSQNIGFKCTICGETFKISK